MGFLSDLINWLSIGAKERDNIHSARIKLRVFIKRLARQVKKLELNAKRARLKAVQQWKEGDIKDSKLQAKNYIQIKNQARSVDIFKMNLEDLLSKSENTNDIKGITQIVQKVSQSEGL